MNLDDIVITATGVQKLPPAAATEMVRRIQDDKTKQQPFRGRVIYLYNPLTGTTEAREYGRVDSHLGAVED